jgi:hypothetical protein
MDIYLVGLGALEVEGRSRRRSGAAEVWVAGDIERCPGRSRWSWVLG